MDVHLEDLLKIVKARKEELLSDQEKLTDFDLHLSLFFVEELSVVEGVIHLLGKKELTERQITQAVKLYVAECQKRVAGKFLDHKNPHRGPRIHISQVITQYFLEQDAAHTNGKVCQVGYRAAKLLLESEFSLKLIDSESLALARKSELADIIQMIKQKLTNDYLNNHENPLIRMYMRFVNVKLLEGDKDAQLDHFITLLTALENAAKLADKDLVALASVPDYHESSSAKQLYSDLLNQLRLAPKAQLIEYYQEFTNLRDLLTKEHQALDLGFFLSKRHLKILSQITQRLTMSIDQGGPSSRHHNLI